ncbi:MAG: NAD(P)-binding protein, partial [Acidobacteria bacterium]|nr:NAD(P)-binding protein [Acidobacteriota bacterium]
MNNQVDIAILGGGLAGLTLARRLRTNRPELTIRVLEKQKDLPQTAAFKVGESTVEIGAHYLAETLGLRQHLQDHHLVKYGFRIFFSQSGNRDITRRTELGVAKIFPTGAFQIDRGRLENFLL